jgi:hypothetical protein
MFNARALCGTRRAFVHGAGHDRHQSVRVSARIVLYARAHMFDKNPCACWRPIAARLAVLVSSSLRNYLSHSPRNARFLESYFHDGRDRKRTIRVGADLRRNTSIPRYKKKLVSPLSLGWKAIEAMVLKELVHRSFRTIIRNMNKISAQQKSFHGLLLGVFLVCMFTASTAYATPTVIPTGPYVPTNPSQNDTQHINVQTGNSSLSASSSGVDINVPGVGSIQADQNGANISFSGFGFGGSGSSGGVGFGTLLLFGLLSPLLLIGLVVLIIVLIRSSRSKPDATTKLP